MVALRDGARGRDPPEKWIQRKYAVLSSRKTKILVQNGYDEFFQMALTEITENLTETEGHANLVALQFCAKHLRPMLEDLAKKQKRKSQALALIKPDGKLRELRNANNEEAEKENVNKNEMKETRGTRNMDIRQEEKVTYRTALMKGESRGAPVRCRKEGEVVNVSVSDKVESSTCSTSPKREGCEKDNMVVISRQRLNKIEEKQCKLEERINAMNTLVQNSSLADKRWERSPTKETVDEQVMDPPPAGGETEHDEMPDSEGGEQREEMRAEHHAEWKGALMRPVRLEIMEVAAKRRAKADFAQWQTKCWRLLCWELNCTQVISLINSKSLVENICRKRREELAKKDGVAGGAVAASP